MSVHLYKYPAYYQFVIRNKGIVSFIAREENKYPEDKS